ncbi:MAG: acetyl-coenzyme A synthetase, partial [Actinomycetota bacterium]|nr:acetyl-coenzyme A synthetase [Actinomycetota bacterium]
MTENPALSNLSIETRHFDPPAELAAQANVGGHAYDEASADRLAFWEKQAQRLDWAQKWDAALEWEPPFAKWFVGGRLNVAVNCLDRHVAAGRG